MTPNDLTKFFLSDDPDEVLQLTETIKNLSSGTITRPERFNSRTKKPERDGLHCCRIFGPLADFTCICGFLSSEKHAGEVCSKCGVPCVEKEVRNERWAHTSSPVGLIHPVLAPQIAEKLRLSPEDLSLLLRGEAELDSNGVMTRIDKMDEKSYVSPGQILSDIQQRLGKDSSLMITEIPICPAGWRDSRLDAQDKAYEKLINRSNRTARLIELNAPIIIIANEELMLQAAFEKTYEVARQELEARKTEHLAKPTFETIHPLLEDLLEHPLDDARRAVYADWLVGKSDPRGEFINLQLTRGNTRRASKRERELLNRHANAWLAPIDKAIAPGFAFNRGFLASCKTKDDQVRDLIGHVAWSTVERIDTNLVDLITHPAMRSLRHISTTFTTFQKLCSGSPQNNITSATIRMTSCPPRGFVKVVETQAFPELRELQLRIQSSKSQEDWSFLFNTPLANQLDDLTLEMPFESFVRLDLEHWIGHFGHHPNLSRLRLSYAKKSLEVAFTRQDREMTLDMTTSRSFVERLAMSDPEFSEQFLEVCMSCSSGSIGTINVRSKCSWFGEVLEKGIAQLEQHFGGKIKLKGVRYSKSSSA